LIFFILVLVLGEIYVQLAYANWKYEFTEEGLKKERGIIFKKYSSVPYVRIQNVDIHRGIFARAFGFSTLMLHTAGYSGVPNAEGNLPAVETHRAEEIRKLIMHKIINRRH
jgi:membrane protein YdbS with pleckstrin-like domain